MADPIHATPAAPAASLLQRIHAEWSRNGWNLADLARFRMDADDETGAGEGGDDDAGEGGEAAGGDSNNDDKSAGEIEKWKALARKHEKEAKRLKSFEAAAQKAQQESQSDADKAIEKAKTEAAEAAGKEATAKANARILRAEIKAAAAGKLADPGDALRLLDLDDFEVDDEGDVDAKAIAKAIDDLVKSKPYLVGKTAGKGSADNGARSNSGDSSKPMSAQERLRQAYSAK